MGSSPKLGAIVKALCGKGDAEGKTRLLDMAQSPLDMLVLTVLSQATSDRNSAQAFGLLKARYATWEEVLSAPTGELEEVIAPGGLAPQKAPRIQEILRLIRAGHGRLTLDFLHDWDDARVFGYLCSLPGVGPKTAGCVLAFSLNRPALPVDTHVLRVVRRLGLVPSNWPAARVQAYLQEVVPREIQRELHLRLIDHGRALCHPSSPGCVRCPLGAMCPTGQAGWLKKE